MCALIQSGFPCGSVVRNPPANAGDTRSLGQEYPLEKERATRSSILAWEIPRTEEPGGLQAMGSQNESGGEEGRRGDQDGEYM